MKNFRMLALTGMEDRRTVTKRDDMTVTALKNGEACASHGRVCRRTPSAGCIAVLPATGLSVPLSLAAALRMSMLLANIEQLN